MPEEIKTFKKGDQTFDVPVSELDSFMSEVPDAVEVNVYEADGKMFDVPVNELDEFMKQVPGAKLKSGSKKKVEQLASGPGRDSFNLGSTPESSSKTDKIERITANLPSSSSGDEVDAVTTLGEFLEINQATPNDLGFATMINQDLPLTQDEVNRYTNIARNNKLAGMPQVSSDYDIKPVLEKTQRQIELDEMDNNDKARQYLSTRVFDESVMGKLIKPVIGKIVGITKEERIHLDELAGMAADIDESGEAESYAYDANMVQRVAVGLLAIMADTPIFGGIGAAVKVPTLAFGRLVGAGVSKAGASTAVVQAMTQIFSSSPQMAAVLGGHAALNELTEQVINQGKVFGEDPENGGVDMGAVAEVGGKQSLVGAMIGPVGSGTSILSNSPKITGLINNIIGQQAAKVGINAAGLVAESAVFAYGDALVDRERKLSDVSGEEFLESLMTIGGLKAMHLPSRIKAPRKSQRTTTEIDAISKHIDTGPESKPGIEQLKADKAKLDAVMNDPNIPWEAKAEIASGINGVNPALWEPVLNRVDLIETPGGVHQLTSYDANGNKISIRDFQSKNEAFREYNNMDQIMQENNTMINIRNADVKEITKVDNALIEIGYPEGIRDQALNDAIITPKPNRTAKQNAMVEDLMDAAGKIKTEPAKEKKAGEKVERPSTELKVDETKDGKFTVTQEGGGEVKAEFGSQKEADKFIENFKLLTEGERTFEQEKAIIDEKVETGEAEKPKPKVTKVEPVVEAPESSANKFGIIKGVPTRFKPSDFYPTSSSGLKVVVGSMKNIKKSVDRMRGLNEVLQNPKLSGTIDAFDSMMEMYDYAKKKHPSNAEKRDAEFKANLKDRSVSENLKKALEDFKIDLDETGMKWDIEDNMKRMINDVADQMQTLYHTPEGRGRNIKDVRTESTSKEIGAGEVKKPDKDTGKQNEAFFTEKSKEASSKVPYEPVIKIDKETPVAKAYDTYSAGGNFTGHISKMIPGFQEKQVSVGEAITKSGAKSFLDIGASEGGLVKTVASQNPDMRAVALDPNSQMKKNFESTPEVKNAEFVQEAYQGSWTEADGTKINEFKPKEKFDVINKDFTFQFVNNDRAKQVAGVKEMLEPDGIFITSEKFHTDNKKANEAKKAEHQEKYFTPEQRTKDAEGIVTGMDKDMVKDVDYYNTLKDNFKYVEEFWNAGEFKGFIASDSKAKLDKFKNDVGDLTTEFTDTKSKTAPAKVSFQIEAHNKEGGSTFSVAGENLAGSAGGSVSIFPERTETIKRDLTEKDLTNFKDRNKDLLAGNEDVLTIGTWKNDAGDVVLDISAVLPTKKAIELGNKYNQEGIMDLETGTFIGTGGDGKTIEGLKAEKDRVQDVRYILGGEPPKGGPPAVKGGPPAKVPPKPPAKIPPGEQRELPEGEKGKPERDVMDVVAEMDKAREAGLKARAQQGVNRISYLFWDQQEPFKRAVQKSAKAVGLGKKATQTVLDRKNTEKGSKAWTALEWDTAMKDITGGITGLGPKSMDLVSRYNDMRRTAELYKSREAFGKEELMMEGGVTLKQAEDFLTRVRKKDPSVLKQYGLKDYDFKKIREASDKFNDRYRDILTELKDEGIITQEAFDAITFEHPYYSPRKFLSSMDKIDSNGSMSGVEALKGGSEGAKIIDAPSLYYEALTRKNNLVARSRTFRAMEQYIAEVDPAFMQRAEYAPDFVEKLSKVEEGDPWIEPKFKDTPKGMENVDYIDANGNKQRFFMDAEVHKYFDIEPFGDMSRKIMHYAGWISGTKPLKAAATGYNPEFLVKNIPIDMMHILNTTNVYSGALPIAHAQITIDMARVAKDVVTRSGSYIDFMKEGGGMDMLTGEGRLRTGVSKRKLSKGVQAFDALEGLASWPGKSSELITRLALRNRHLENAKRDFTKEFKREPTAKELKEMQLDATAYSRNYLDFEQGGRLTKMADSVIPYLNAGVQVTRGSLRAAGKNPALYGAKVAQIATVAGGITAWNMGLFSEDPEEGEAMKNTYLNDISDEVKARSFVVMTPFKYEDASGVEKYVYFKIQKDNAQELITGVAETRVLKEVMGDNAPKYLSNRRLKELQVMTESATNVSQLPPAVRGALGYTLNKDFFYKGDLWMGYDMGKDKSLEYKRDTPERYKAMGKIPMPGGYKLSPIRSHYVAKQFLTESNVIATGIGELMDKAVSGASPDLKTEYTPDQVEKFINAPFPRRFFKSTYPGASKQGSDTHQQEYNKIKQEHNHGLQKLIDKEASPEEVFTWIGSIIEKGDGITPLKEYERLSRRYKEEVIKPSVNSWVESLKYVDAVPRAKDLFDQWVHMDDDTRDYLLESAAIAGVLSETTIVELTNLMDEYESEMKGVGAGEWKKEKKKKD